MKVALNKVTGLYIAESPAKPERGIEMARDLAQAKQDFIDQTDVDTYVAARGGTAGQFTFVADPQS